MSQTPTVWTARMILDLDRMWRIEGWPIADIARKIGVSYDAVTYQAGVLNLCQHPLKSGWTGNLRIPRSMWSERDFAFWTRPLNAEESRA